MLIFSIFPLFLFWLYFSFAIHLPKNNTIQYIDKHSIFKVQLGSFGITCLKVTRLFVLHYPTIYIQAEIKTLVILSLTLSFSLCLLITISFYYICKFNFIQIALRSNNNINSIYSNIIWTLKHLSCGIVNQC